MPDPLDALLYELWILCITFATDGQESGPLELLRVSNRWDEHLLSTSTLWNQIYIHNGEDEFARISAFLYFSKECLLHVDMMTALPSLESLQLIANHISRVTTISIRPSASDTITALQMERWKRQASYILVRLSNGLSVPDMKDASCFGISLWEDNQLYYCIILMEFTMANTVNSTDRETCSTPAESPGTTYSQMWEDLIMSTTRNSADQDTNARTDSVYSFVKLASYAQHHDPIRTAIPSCIRLLKDDDGSVQSATIDALHKFAVHIKLHEALGLAIPSLITLLRSESVSLLEKLAEQVEICEVLRLSIPALIKLLEYKDWYVQSATVSVLGNLAKYDELCGELGLTIPLLIKLLEHGYSDVRVAALSLLKKLTEHDKLHQSIRLTIPALSKLLKNAHQRDLEPTTSVLFPHPTPSTTRLGCFRDPNLRVS